MERATIILLGATGDLARRKLIPALIELARLTQLTIIGAAEDEMSREQFQHYVRPSNITDDQWHSFAQHLYYQQFNAAQKQSYDELLDFANKFPAEHRIVYCAMPPELFCTITELVGKSGLVQKGKPHQVIVYEKPFGQDLKSAKTLNECVADWFTEDQVFRIDHYLTKEMVENITLVRFTNTIFEPIWNGIYIDSVHIVLHEDVGLEGRGAYYDTYGVLKDVVQNHMLQLLALVAMEEPVSLSGDAVRDAKVNLLKSVTVKDGLLGQYEGYRNEDHVHKDSTTPTFALLELAVNNERWRGARFFLSTGKALDHKATYIRITFRTVTCSLERVRDCLPNVLTISIYPEGGYSLALNVKEPRTSTFIRPEPPAHIKQVDMHYLQFVEKKPAPEYLVIFEEILSHQISVGVRFDEIEEQWRITDQILAMDLPQYTYTQGSTGPQEAETFAQKKGIAWSQL